VGVAAVQSRGTAERPGHPADHPDRDLQPDAFVRGGAGHGVQAADGRPYPIGAQPDIFFRTDAPVDEQIRRAYEACQTPWETDLLNIEVLGRRGLGVNPLGDPIPFSCHLIGQLANDTGYSTQWNLDSDRAFAYLTWDWVRNTKATEVGGGPLNLPFHPPIEPPQGMDGWAQGTRPLLLTYKDPPKPRDRPPPPIG